MNWDKTILKQTLLQLLNEDLRLSLLAAQTAHEGATHEDAQAKSKYDTHGLELSYLAGSQFERARTLQAQIKRLEQQPLLPFAADDSADIGALVILEGAAGQRVHYLLLGLGAGVRFRYEDVDIQVISPDSPVGRELTGLGVGDSFQPEGAAPQGRWTLRGLY